MYLLASGHEDKLLNGILQYSHMWPVWLISFSRGKAVTRCRFQFVWQLGWICFSQSITIRCTEQKREWTKFILSFHLKALTERLSISMHSTHLDLETNWALVSCSTILWNVDRRLQLGLKPPNPLYVQYHCGVNLWSTFSVYLSPSSRLLPMFLWFANRTWFPSPGWCATRPVLCS